MYIANISIKGLLKNKELYIFIGAIVTIIVFIVLGLSSLNQRILGKKISNIFDYLYDNKKNIFTIDSYYTEYDATIVSNKNVNTYSIKEWYGGGERFRYEFLDYEKNLVTIIINQNNIYIKNPNQKGYMVLKEYVNNTSNLMSLKTFIDIYNELKNGTNKCNCKAETYSKNNEMRIKISGKCDCVSNCNTCNKSKVLDGNTVIECVLDAGTGLPKTYTIYEKGKERICIVYDKVEVNSATQDSMFSIDK